MFLEFFVDINMKKNRLEDTSLLQIFVSQRNKVIIYMEKLKSVCFQNPRFWAVSHVICILRPKNQPSGLPSPQIYILYYRVINTGEHCFFLHFETFIAKRLIRIVCTFQ